jgi:hypothetical protein
MEYPLVTFIRRWEEKGHNRTEAVVSECRLLAVPSIYSCVLIDKNGWLRVVDLNDVRILLPEFKDTTEKEEKKEN